VAARDKLLESERAEARHVNRQFEQLERIENDVQETDGVVKEVRSTLLALGRQVCKLDERLLAALGEERGGSGPLSTLGKLTRPRAGSSLPPTPSALATTPIRPRRDSDDELRAQVKELVSLVKGLSSGAAATSPPSGTAARTSRGPRTSRWRRRQSSAITRRHLS